MCPLRGRSGTHRRGPVPRGLAALFTGIRALRGDDIARVPEAGTTGLGARRDLTRGGGAPQALLRKGAGQGPLDARPQRAHGDPRGWLYDGRGDVGGARGDPGDRVATGDAERARARFPQSSRDDSLPDRALLNERQRPGQRHAGRDLRAQPDRRRRAPRRSGLGAGRGAGRELGRRGIPLGPGRARARGQPRAARRATRASRRAAPSPPRASETYDETHEHT